VVVKFTEWWLGPTTTDQCGQNPDIYYMTQRYLLRLMGLAVVSRWKQ